MKLMKDHIETKHRCPIVLVVLYCLGHSPPSVLSFENVVCVTLYYITCQLSDVHLGITPKKRHAKYF
jgi:hypothetical protein